MTDKATLAVLHLEVTYSTEIKLPDAVTSAQELLAKANELGAVTKATLVTTSMTFDLGD